MQGATLPSPRLPVPFYNTLYHHRFHVYFSIWHPQCCTTIDVAEWRMRFLFGFRRLFLLHPTKTVNICEIFTFGVDEIFIAFGSTYLVLIFGLRCPDLMRLSRIMEEASFRWAPSLELRCGLQVVCFAMCLTGDRGRSLSQPKLVFTSTWATLNCTRKKGIKGMVGTYLRWGSRWLTPWKHPGGGSWGQTYEGNHFQLSKWMRRVDAEEGIV